MSKYMLLKSFSSLFFHLFMHLTTLIDIIILTALVVNAVFLSSTIPGKITHNHKKITSSSSERKSPENWDRPGHQILLFCQSLCCLRDMCKVSFDFSAPVTIIERWVSLQTCHKWPPLQQSLVSNSDSLVSLKHGLSTWEICDSQLCLLLHLDHTHFKTSKDNRASCHVCLQENSCSCLCGLYLQRITGGVKEATESKRERSFAPFTTLSHIDHSVLLFTRLLSVSHDS